MFRISAIILTISSTLVFAVPAAAQMASTNATGMFLIRPTGKPLAPGAMILQQEGSTVIGSYGKGGTIKGTISATNPHELDVNWSDSRGSGWGTIKFAPNWNSFQGQWGLPGQPASGDLYASRVLMQINTAGLWNVKLTGQMVHNAQLQFHQKGSSFVGTWPGGHITGTIPAGTTSVNGTWQTKASSGPLTMKFSSDGNSFAGTWGYPGQPAKGRVFGTRVMAPGAVK